VHGAGEARREARAARGVVVGGRVARVEGVERGAGDRVARRVVDGEAQPQTRARGGRVLGGVDGADERRVERSRRPTTCRRTPCSTQRALSPARWRRKSAMRARTSSAGRRQLSAEKA
jgi:hypothetical protein